ncbi:solute carrier family 39 (zinc transporter), member 1/2/3 [Entomortierella parvispora]|uniref:Solute carrier family 39 (Zinc transporter), member 1/2/3 n=1 Tax=Entomortierella parvispora TaxID=205924 RepID=A0A9P3M1K6_9FUNG|nr:solute carrier family 39 (zinc transporter), member 1/2/3 [Entomortierella parvispora]
MSSNATSTSDFNAQYDMPMHIGALFINMAASGAGVLLPLLFSLTNFKEETTKRIAYVISIARTFGSGVILATAFIHMLPDAFQALTDPSLPWEFQDAGYSNNWPGFIAMTAALFLHLLEFCATQRVYNREREVAEERNARFGQGHSHGDHHDNKGDSGSLEEERHKPNTVPDDNCLHVGHVHGGEILLVNKATRKQTAANEKVMESGMASLDEDVVVVSKTDSDRPSRVIATYILELGIAMHSVIIGISLATTVGSAFISLVIALIFHQFFEGVALGGRIAALKFSPREVMPWLLAMWFTFSTPLGVALGIGIRESYNGGSVTALIVQGTFDSCSAGILLYTALVQLIASEMNGNKNFRDMSTKDQVTQFVALWLGAAAMAVVGKWA